METVIIAEGNMVVFYYMTGGIFLILGVLLAVLCFWPFPPRGGGVA